MNDMQELSIKLLELSFYDDDYELFQEKRKEILNYVERIIEDARQDGFDQGCQESENQYTVDIGS